MPTPRPIIVARVAPVSGIATRCPISPTVASAIPRPTTAEMIGIPIATRLPRTSVRMNIAARMPTSSLLSVGCSESSLPMDDGGRDLDAGVLRRLGGVEDRLRRLLSRSPDPTSSSTGANAVCLSFDNRPAV